MRVPAFHLKTPLFASAPHFPSHPSISSSLLHVGSICGQIVNLCGEHERPHHSAWDRLRNPAVWPHRATNSNYCGDTQDNAIRGDKEVYYYFDVFSYISPTWGHSSVTGVNYFLPSEHISRRRAGHPASWREHSDTFADPGVCVESVASGTFALEASKGVDAHAPLAQARQLLALVDVCRKQRVRPRLLYVHVVVL